MFLVQITFGTDGGARRNRESLKHAAEDYLASLHWNWQVCGEDLLTWSEGQLIGYTRVARPDSLAKRHHSQWGISSLNNLIEAFGGDPRWRIIDDDVPKRFPTWRRSSSFYLFTHAFDDASPVCCGDSGEPIPVYLLPIPDQDRRDIYSWAGSYKHLDNIWLHSGALEIPAYKQLADPESELSVTGRELCARIEKATEKPTFYYLMRYWGRNDGEATRPCPLCGGEWRISDQNADTAPFHKFPFKCDGCRLVSRIAVSFEDERHARIGERKQGGER
jgi:predicted  nucleic acid-binding Zn ribbon protein